MMASSHPEGDEIVDLLLAKEADVNQKSKSTHPLFSLISRINELCSY